MEQIRCPKCGSVNWRCWDERQITWWEKDGSMGAIQIIGCLACNDCGCGFADVSPTDEELQADGLFCEDEEHDATYRIGWR